MPDSVETLFSVTSVTFERILTKLQSVRGECSAPGRQEMAVRGLRDRVRSDPVVCSGASQFCPDGLWRFDSEHSSIMRNVRRSLQSPNRSQESQIVLGSSGTGLRYVALLPGALDLLRSLLTPRIAEPICRRRRPLPAYCSHDGSGRGAAAPPSERTRPAHGIT